MSVKSDRRYTLEEYIELDRKSDMKLEYWYGEIFAKVGGTINHNSIASNLITELGIQLKNRKCQVFGSEQQIKVPDAPPYKYADVSVVCGQPVIEVLQDQEMLINPILLIEVLSPSTEAFDRGDKFTAYKSIVSFREYLLIAQHRPHITHFIKQSDNAWSYAEINDINEKVVLISIICTLSISDIYRDVEFQTKSLRQE